MNHPRDLHAGTAAPPSDATLFSAIRDWLGAWRSSAAAGASAEAQRAHGRAAATQMIAAVQDSVQFHESTDSIARALFDDDDEVAASEARTESSFYTGFREELRDAAVSAASEAAGPGDKSVVRLFILFVSAILSVAAVFCVLACTDDWRFALGAALYCLGLLAVTGCSLMQFIALRYAGLTRRAAEDWRDQNRLSIFALICGTQLVEFANRYAGQPAALYPLWVCAGGATLYAAGQWMLGRDSRPFRALRVIIYVVQAWLPFVLWGDGLWDFDRPGLTALLIGGIIYTAGGVVYLRRKSTASVGPGGNWYITVVIAWLFHFYFVLMTLRLAPVTAHHAGSPSNTSIQIALVALGLAFAAAVVTFLNWEKPERVLRSLLKQILTTTERAAPHRG